MSATFFDLMKYASTGIASPDMTAYDKTRALAAFGGGAVQTLTDVPPLSFKSDGTPLISWSMLGNGQQTGTPIMPNFCGDRTVNLFDCDRTEGIIDNSYIRKSDGATVTDTNYYISYPIYVLEGSEYTWTFNNENQPSHFSPTVGFYDASDNLIGFESYAGSVRYFAFTPPSGCKYIRASVYKRYNMQREAMLNTGSTALPYEPYGYKIPITCAGQTVPVYLGQVQTVRRIKKLVLTGEETGWAKNEGITANNAFILYDIQDYQRTNGICTHYPAASSSSTTTDSVFYGKAINFCTELSHGYTVTTWKAYLAEQYANGTPVIIWYVLATPETGIVNEPLCKIGDYADELHSEDTGVTIPTAKGQNTLTVDTELQPSSMTITYKV